jgi:hypothetical protein
VTVRNVAAGLAAPLLEFAAAISLLLLPLVTHTALDYAGTTAASPETVEDWSDQTIKTLLGNRSFLDIAVLPGHPLYTQADAAHLDHVRLALHSLWLLGLVAGGIIIACLWRSPSPAGTWRAIRHGSLTLLGVLGATAVACLVVGFDTAWIRLHELVIPDGIFDHYSSLVFVYPIRFWLALMCVGAGCLVAITIFVILAAHWRIRRITTTSAGQKDAPAT